MCNLYAMLAGQDSTRRHFAVDPARDYLGNAEPLPAIWPKYEAPILRLGEDGTRELISAHWGPAGAGDVMKVDTLSTTWALKTLHRIWLVVDGLGMGQSFAGAGTESIRSLARFQGAAGTRRKA